MGGQPVSSAASTGARSAGSRSLVDPFALGGCARCEDFCASPGGGSWSRRGAQCKHYLARRGGPCPLAPARSKDGTRVPSGLSS
eukprot:6896351-Pyramimonas_sp.AAC.1